MITSLTFLVSGAICSQLFVQPAFAANPHYCFEHDCGGDRICDNNPKKGTATCCFRDPGTIPQSTTCQTCHVNTTTGEFENCTSASEGQTGPGIIAPPPSGVAPPPPTESCPENTARDANGNCTPLTQTPEQAPTNQTLGPKGRPGNLLPGGIFEGQGKSPQQGESTPEVAPPTGQEGDNQTQSRINTSPTGGCIPFIRTNCVPCDPGLPGGDCILEDDWETTIGTTAAGAVACGPPPMPACGPHSPPPPPPPTNHVVKGPQGGEAEQPPATEEAPQAAPPSTAIEEPTCPAGQELDEDTNLCVPVSQEQGQEQQQPQVEEEQPQPEEDQSSDENNDN